MREDEAWFEERSLGRIAVVHRRGWLTAAALGILVVAGLGIEGACRPDHPVLALVPLGLLTLKAAWTMAARTRRSGSPPG